MKLRRIGDDHDVGTGDHVLIGVEATEAVVVVDRDLVGIFELECGPRFLDAVHAHVGDGHQANAFIGIHRVHGRGRTTIPCADHAQPDDIAAGCRCAIGQAQARDRRRSLTKSRAKRHWDSQNA